MLNLIDDMLNLSRITQQEVSKSNFDLSLMAQKIVDELAAQTPKRKFVFKCEKNSVVFADLNLMKILMYNLLSNAWKYSSKKEKTLIEFGKTVKNDGKFFFIKDNGAGFDMTYAGKLLTPFQRLHSAAEFEGTGVGLAIVKRILDKHGGKIWFESKINEGAVFYFTV